jgi:hypothetical protein
MEPKPESTVNTKFVKPKVLYHSSWNTEIKQFEPRNEKVRDPLEGPVIFATPDKAYASCFLVPSDDSWVKIGRYSTNGIPGSWKVVVSDEDRFKQLDKGGAIYHLPSKPFKFHPERNMAEIEWTSTQAVEPTDKEEYGSGLQAMQRQGVDVYFVDEATFEAIKQSDDQGKSIIDSLTPIQHAQ